MSATPRRRVERAIALSSGRPVEQYDGIGQSGPRCCTYPGCVTRLSRYNPNASCSAHGGWLDADDRRNRDIL